MIASRERLRSLEDQRKLRTDRQLPAPDHSELMTSPLDAFFEQDTLKVPLQVDERFALCDGERCEALVLPPAWEEVWVCPHADGHLQAMGTDEAGRRQYRYHDRWTEARAAWNFDRLAAVGERLADVRRAVERDLDSDDPCTRAMATMVGLLSVPFFASREPRDPMNVLGRPLGRHLVLIPG